MNRKNVALLLLCAPLCGCAYLTNYTRGIDLKDGSVSIDVKQRVVFSQKHPGNNGKVVVCAEPSPDALTVIGASGGLSVSSPAGKAANLSAALSETGSSIGLRTQSIQLLRDAMYRLCEGYAAGAVAEGDFSAMQRRYQSTMMGLIAIEQLTGPIVASQALLMSHASASAGASAGDAAVDAAKTGADQAADATLQAQTDLDGAQTALASTREEIRSNGDKLRAEQAKKDAKKDFDPATLDTLQSRQATLAAQEKTHLNEVADKQRRLEDKRKRLTLAEADLKAARSRAGAQAGGSGRLGDVASATRQSNEAFAKAVEAIVVEINNSYSRDSCLALVTNLINRLPGNDAGTPVKDPRIDSLEREVSVATARTREATEAFNRAVDQLQESEARKSATPEISVRRAAAEAASRRVLQARSELEAATVALREARRSEASPNTVLVTGLEVCQQILKLQAKDPAKPGPSILGQAGLARLTGDVDVAPPETPTPEPDRSRSQPAPNR